MPIKTKEVAIKQDPTSFAGWYEAWIAFSRDKWLRAIQDRKAMIASYKRDQKAHIKANQLEYVEYDQRHIEQDKIRLKELRANQKKALKLTVPTAEETYKKLIKHPQIVSVIIDGNNLRIATKPLFHDSRHCENCQNPDENHYCDDCETCSNPDYGCNDCSDCGNNSDPLSFTDKLGRFDIQLYKDNYSGSDRLNNLDYYADSGLDHPHIKDGRPCLGSYGNSIETYHDKGHLFLLADTYIHYIQQAHKDSDSYLNMGDWFDCREERNHHNED